MNIDELRESLLFAPKNGYTQLSDAQRQEIREDDLRLHQHECQKPYHPVGCTKSE